MTSHANALLTSLLGHSPFDGFPADQFPADPGNAQGWGYKHWVLTSAIEMVKPLTIIEVGTWRGASAIVMATACKSLNLDAAVICVDTWLGSPEHFLNPEKHGPSLNRKWGYPQLYHAFMSNVIKSNCQDIIIPLPSPSESAAVILSKKGIQADLLYIDAAHEYEPALRDFNAYWPLLNEGGVLIGDDYIGWKGVTRAAKEFAAAKGVQITGGYGKFVVRKGAPLPPEWVERFEEDERKRREEAAKNTSNG